MSNNKPIRDLVLPVSTVNPSASGSGEFRYIDIGSVDRETKSIVGANLIGNHEAPSRARQLVKAGDVLVSTVRPNLNAVAIVPDELDGAIASTGFTVLRPDRDLLDSRYLFNWVKSPVFVAKMVKVATGANYPAVSDRTVKVSEIPTPEDVKEQKRIAEVLDKADALRQKRRLALQKLDSLLQSVFLDMFGDPVMNTKDWVRKKADDLTTLVSSGITPLGGSSIYVSKGIPFIRSQNVLMNAFDMSDVAFVTKDLHNQMRRTWVKNGDVLFNITGASIGRVHFYAGDDDSANVNQHVCIIRPDQKQVLTEFLSYFLSLPSFQASILGRNAGATRQAFNFQQIRNFDVIVPPRADQAKFVSIRKTIEAMKERMIESAVNINKAFGSIQQRAFKG